MAREKSAGIILFRKENDKRFYLLLNYTAGHWDFPKGNIESGESEKDAAIREMREETSIFVVDFDPEFREETKYMLTRNGIKILKTVTFFLGETAQEDVILSHEHKDAKWMPFEFAYKTLTYDTAKELLKKAENYLNCKSDGDLECFIDEIDDDDDEE